MIKIYNKLTSSTKYPNKSHQTTHLETFSTHEYMTLLSLYNLHCAKDPLKWIECIDSERVAGTFPTCLRSRWALLVVKYINNHETTVPSEISLIGQFKTMLAHKLCTLIGGDVEFFHVNFNNPLYSPESFFLRLFQHANIIF